MRHHPGITIHATEKLSYLENNGKLIKEERDGRNAQESTFTDAECETLREQRTTDVDSDEDFESQKRPRILGGEASPDALAGYVTCCDATRAFGRGSFSYCPYCGRALYPDELPEEQD